MKIVILDMDDIKNPHWGSGQAIATGEIGKRLAKKHSIIVYCSKYPGWSDYSYEGIKYRHIGLGTRNSKINNIAYIFCLPFVVRKIKADVILEHFTAPISTCFTPLFTKIPVVGITSFFASEEMSKKYKINFNIVRNFGIKFYKSVIALNSTHEQTLKKLNPKLKIVIIPNGIGRSYFQYKTNEGDYILFIGRLDVYQKGLDMLIKAFSDCAKVIDEELFIAGGSAAKADRQTLTDLIEKYKLSNRVKLLGRVKDADKNLLLVGARFMVFPSRYEGQSLSMLESMALGKPILCFDIEDLSWITSNSCLKVSPFDISKFSKSMIELSKNSSIRRNLGQNAKVLARGYTWEKTASKYEEFLHDVSVAWR